MVHEYGKYLMRLLDNSELKFFSDVPSKLFRPFERKVKKLAPEFWATYAYNRDRSNVLFKYNGDARISADNISDIDYSQHKPEVENVRTFPAYEDKSWREIIDPIIDWILIENNCTPGGIVNKLLLSRIIPGGYIEPHWDEEPTQMISKRMHVVVTSNDKSEFTVNSKTWYLKPAQAFELNNMYDHSVYNGGDKDRVHFMIDYYHPDHIKEIFYGRMRRDPAECDISVNFNHNMTDAFNYYNTKRETRLQESNDTRVPLYIKQ